jgi:hypothetical protein
MEIAVRSEAVFNTARAASDEPQDEGSAIIY